MDHDPSVIDLTEDSPPLLAQTRMGPSRHDTPHTTSARRHRARNRRDASSDEEVSILDVRVATPNRRRQRRTESIDRSGPLLEAPPGQRIQEGIPPGPYTRRRPSLDTRPTTAHASNSPHRMQLMERLEMLASRYMARANQPLTVAPQTLLRPYAHAATRVQCGQPVPSKRFNPAWTHPLAPMPGFSQSIVEPAIDVEAVSRGEHDAVVPMPNTTPICARCHRALLMNGSGDDRIWALPCGHVIDGRCVAHLSNAPSGKPHLFVCPVSECKQRCHPEPGHSHSCIEVYI